LTVRATRILSSALALLIALSCFAGCGDNKKTSFIMRTFSTLGTENDSKAYCSILAAYSKNHRHIVINDTSTTPSGSYKMELSLPSTYRGAGTPDVIYYSAISDMSELSDYFVTVDDIRKDYPDFAKNVSEAALNSVAADNGGRYCIPIRGEWRGIVINAALFRKNALRIPTTWEDILRAAKNFEKSDISLFANSLEESDKLIEYMVRSIGGLHSLRSAMNGTPDTCWDTALEAIEELDELNAFPDMSKGSFDSLVSSSELKHTAADGAGAAIKLFNSGKAAILLMDNTMCGQINADLDSQYIELPRVGTSSFSDATTASNSYPTNVSSGPVYPEMTANTLPPDIQPSPSPTEPSGPDDAGDSKETESDSGLYVSFGEGFYITKKAYFDKMKRDDVLEFIEYFLDEDNLCKLCGEHQAPSLKTISKKALDNLTAKSNIYDGVIKSVQNSEHFITSTHTRENSFFWDRCSLAVSCMSKGILSREAALKLIADPQLTVKELHKTSGKRKELSDD
jgi:ABC-type sugar transport system, periplasmic component